MKIALINPNSTASMTDKVRQAARKAAAPGTEILAANPADAPPSIEGHYDEAASLAGLLREIKKAQRWGADAYVVACFDDPGLGACREIVTGPVLGICEAAMHIAATLATSFSVVTTLGRSTPIIEQAARRYGMAHLCKNVRAAEIPVLALEQEDSGAAAKKIEQETRRAIAEDRCEAVILGCAGMADLATELTQKCGVPVIDGVVCALKMCEAIVGAGLSTSKIGAYAPPRKK
ncbi:aspartate/glutamate racemase family protein [Candidatus Spongiihabitans sp.]|uniref:aspartate/glutamate racemase family protein n=1 Tax=Candidatus Spongiihabitans sp. TaxID=3101308 RepID=UPI003C6F6A68